MRTFIAFSKSESSKISRVPSTNAAETAWRTSRPPLKDRLVVGVGLKEDEVAGEVEEDVGRGCCSGGIRREGSESPRSMKTSHTRSWAGNGIE